MNAPPQLQPGCPHADIEGGEPRPWLPNLLREMADAFNLDTALKFAEGFGGRYLSLPSEARAEHPVAQALGVAVLAWLIERHDRLERIVVPRGPGTKRRFPSNELRQLLAGGASTSDIAASMGIHVRTAHAWKRRLREDDAAQLRATSGKPST